MKKVNFPIYFSSLLIFGGIGIMGVNLESMQSTPQSVYSNQDLNNDGRDDIIIKLRNGNNYVFIQQEDGTYIKLDQYKKQQLQRIEDLNKTQRRLLNIQLDSIDVKVSKF